MNNIIQEKDAEIENLKKQLKLPSEGAVQTIELKIVLQEKEVLQTKLQNTKSIVGTIKDEKYALEDKIKYLKDKVDKMSIADPSIYLASELGILSVKELELKKVQDELEEAKKSVLDKDKLLAESLTNTNNLQRQVKPIRHALKDTKFLLWDNIMKEVKKLKDHLIMLQDERYLLIRCSSNVALVQESMGDKPIQAQKSIDFLNSQSKTQLEFARIQDKADLISQEKKYIVKDTLAREVALEANFLKTRVEQFKKYVYESIYPGIG